MQKWYEQNNERNTLECPLCRRCITEHPFKKASYTREPSPNCPFRTAINTLNLRRGSAEEVIREESLVLLLINNQLFFPLEESLIMNRSLISSWYQYINHDEDEEHFHIRMTNAQVELYNMAYV